MSRNRVLRPHPLGKARSEPDRGKRCDLPIEGGSLFVEGGDDEEEDGEMSSMQAKTRMVRCRLWRRPRLHQSKRKTMPSQLCNASCSAATTSSPSKREARMARHR
ncbi:MAG: hypothetical protein WC483_00160 [Candidatus Paceibacterota bacterium]